jgi:hypothetical protein
MKFFKNIFNSEKKAEVRAAVYKRPEGFDRKQFYSSEVFENKSVYSWNYKTGNLKIIPISTEGHVVETHPRDKSLSVIVSRFGGRLSLVNWEKETEITFYQLPQGEYFYGHCAFSENGEYVVASGVNTKEKDSTGILYVFETLNLKLVSVINIPRGLAHDLINIKKNEFLVSCSGYAKESAFIIFDYDQKKFTYYPVSATHSNKVTSIGHFKKFGNKIFANFQELVPLGGRDSEAQGALISFDLKNFGIKFEMPFGVTEIHSEMLSLEYDPDTKWAWITLPAQHRVVVWDTDKNELKKIIHTAGVVTSITLLPELKTVFMGVVGQFMAFHSQTLERIETIESTWKHQQLSTFYCAHSRLA